MSILPYHQSDTIKARNLQVWNNAAFDEVPDAGKPLRSFRPPVNKENCDPNFSKPIKNPTLRKTSSPKVVHFKIGHDVLLSGKEEKSIDSEIEEVEKEIKRLCSRLEVLKTRKAEKDLKAVMEERRGRIVAARFKDSKKNQRTPGKDGNKIEDTPITAEFRRRGLSLGPQEITPLQSAKGRLKIAEQPYRGSKNKSDAVELRKRRGLSLGPVEITSSASMNRRRDTMIRENKGKKVTTDKKVGVRRSLSVSPESGKLMSKISQLRKGVETVGGSWNKSVRKDATMLKPKTLFNEEEKEEEEEKRKVKALATKKVMKAGRFVSSRYSIITQPPESKRRKWSLSDTEELNELEKSPGAAAAAASVEYKKQLGSEEDNEKKAESEMNSPVYRLLPKIQTSRLYLPESPRDSGAVKRAVEVIGRRSHFGGIMESFSSQGRLTFEDDDQTHQQQQ